MTGREIEKMKLSKSILEMKFMKRTKEKVEQQLFQTEGEEYFESQLTTRLKKESGKYLIEPSFLHCEKLIEGRLSFQGMNPEIEKLIEAELNEEREKLEKLKEEDVSETQMAEHFKSYNPSKKNKNRNRKKRFSSDGNRGGRQCKRIKFMKPSD
ncbi:M-phase phosphoprotein 6 [Diachasmimorpha longicaudata]|uniref:M-phase phosphoprotein 6 n=1 Tax=Diachasmimorpha longicaudata TaxID=58733 RepID=UPI0030B8EA9A